MFGWLAQKIDRASIKIRLGTTLRQRADKWTRQGYSQQEAEQQAKQELLTAMHDIGFSPVKCSPQGCDAFCKAFLETPLSDP
jgi:hypothetical protein